MSWCSPRCSSSSVPSARAAFSLLDLIFWRVIGGLGVGAARVIAPAYIAEVSPASIRGRMGSLQQLAIVTGIFIALLSDASSPAPPVGGSAALARVPGLAVDVLAGSHPGPRLRVWSLAFPSRPATWCPRARCRGGQVLKTGIDERMAGDPAHRHSERARLVRPKRKGTGLLPIVWIGIALSVFQQFVGINVIFYYSSALWRRSASPRTTR